MNGLLPFIISGVPVGAVYALAATGLVVTYKTSGVFNFGHGALATAAAYLFYWLHVDHELDWRLSLILSVGVFGPVLGLVMERFARDLSRQRTIHKVVGTVGLLLVVQGLGTIMYGTTTKPVQQFLPGAQSRRTISGVVITDDRLILIAIALGGIAALGALFRWSRTGLEMRAVVEDPDLLAARGTSPVRVRRTAWIIGCTLASLSGVLILPLIGLNATALTFLVVQAFAGAAVGRLTSIPLTLAGGLFVGIGASVLTKFSLNAKALSGLPASLPFLVLLAALLLYGRRLVPLTRHEARPAPRYTAPPRIRLAAAVVVLGALVAIPGVAGDRMPYFTSGVISAIMLLSIGLLVRTSGQVSLCHGAFAAIGAVSYSQLHLDAGLPWIVALPLGALVAVPVGALIALPAIRLSGLFLALATFGFGILVQQLLYPQSWMFTSLAQGRTMPRPGFATSERAFYYVALAALVLTSVAIVLIQRSRLGRMLRGMADSPVGVASMGLDTNVTKVIVFCLSAFIAALAGALFGMSRHFAAGGDAFFTPLNSLTLVAMLVVVPFAEPWYAVVLAVSSVIPGYLPDADVPYWLNVMFGVSAIAVASAGGNPPMPERLRRLLDRWGGRTPGSHDAVRGDVPARPEKADGPARRGTGRPGLGVRSLDVAFGGLHAVRDLTLTAPTGQITGLIGPNGAGKTTTFNACSGLNRRVRGEVSLHGRSVAAMGPSARARRGLSRTFQSVELCDTLTVFDNVWLGSEAARAGARPWRQLAASPSARRDTRRAALDAIALCGLGDIAGRQVGELSTGQRRLVELARCMAGDFDVLLLDEPSSGLDVAETEAFADLLRRVQRERGTAILLVEHDVDLVMRLCSYIYVLDFGELIFEGTPEAVHGSELVRDAYLGAAPGDGPGDTVLGSARGAGR
ncbi:branched-chain amino acid ABC transporter permease/ATP-binding protein [Actinomadura roseirufa]|uniref:branched-chain amino acid ABC transporter permease/ATP-binding protein n=1 Tax=Actinomadura roseirufa TaxID=2094049 RepID=UPI00104163B4|nr:branched-chain amino acid ABC transporter permease/ATP-binding protein [Actinomadura roseirufa]